MKASYTGSWIVLEIRVALGVWLRLGGTSFGLALTCHARRGVGERSGVAEAPSLAIGGDNKG